MTETVSLFAGQKVGQGRFVLRKFLGGGGLGQVWVAEDRILEKYVALKFMLAANGYEAIRILFEETSRARKLCHPHIVQTYDFYQPENEPPFVAMEYVPGKSLTECRRFNWPQLEPLVRQWCDALQYAHDEGLIHWDLKPSNVLVDPKGQMKLTDFGIAAVVLEVTRSLKQEATSIVTPHYMSPQQLAGEPANLADDIYSLGASLYELLTGKKPYVYAHPAGIGQLIWLNPFPPLEAFTPLHVSQAVIACLARNPEDRPQSAKEFWERLKKPVCPTPVIAVPSSPLTQVPSEPQQIGSQRGEYWTNSLEMPFVPVPGTELLFCIWQTRVRDYAVYASANPGCSEEWKNPGFTQEPNHPVVNVNWHDAKAFCQWLTNRDRQTGKLAAEREYRLPTDAEWSDAVGICEKGNGKPKEKSGGINDVYPWGLRWPPPKGAGNYAQLLGVDDFEFTSPVGSFIPNFCGLYDLSGNVWEWCEDFYDGRRESRVLRGGSWYCHHSEYLLSSFRSGYLPHFRIFDNGFRLVLAKVPKLIETAYIPRRAKRYWR